MRVPPMLLVFCVGALAGCGTQQLAPAAPGAAAPTHVRPAAATFTSMYSFQGVPDGAFPEASLHYDPTTKGLIGTTIAGGANGQPVTKNLGTIFEIDSSGKEHVLHNFTGIDGDTPKAGIAGIYGTTFAGGPSRHGTVYALDAGGQVRLVHAFSGEPDGSQPSSKLLLKDHQYFGTTRTGGSNFDGTVFSVKPNGSEKVVHSFTGPPNDGALPVANVINVKGNLYGTTSRGGATDQGTVFEISSNGTESVLYSFKGGTDGALPLGDLAFFNNALYGTTRKGGVNGGGTIFAVQLTGGEKVVHSFYHDEGTHPRTGLTGMGGNLYGVASAGGDRYGTIFEMSITGHVHVLHAFDGADGSQPISALIPVSGTLYGTTLMGGPRNLGTAFSIRP